eukprot:gnl/TRDRNA2_/TRDRNA2_129992_c0_seq2.p2 gnl/TRDRNA2_/TRDRNA2_129992_c0~~gnl/TRDRNA2_/TRDRNA2_129992_c0_seq2.p2  ORF type:complete len:109 (-),score=5.07 gnl/TRDRNA2_/TRDRNA2_129992_c0_seq2:97-423(-)
MLEGKGKPVDPEVRKEAAKVATSLNFFDLMCALLMPVFASIAGLSATAAGYLGYAHYGETTISHYLSENMNLASKSSPWLPGREIWSAYHNASTWAETLRSNGQPFSR